VTEDLTITVIDTDGHYLGIEIRASNGCFAGYALDQFVQSVRAVERERRGMATLHDSLL
jgi:hypothetical protein